MARNTAPVTALLALSVTAAYAYELSNGGDAVCEAWGLVPAHPSLETVLSSMFLHDPNEWGHLLGNLGFLIVFGAIVEKALGSLRFLGLYAVSGIGGAALHIIVNHGSSTPLIGCSGALFGLMAVAAVLRPRLIGFAVAFGGVAVYEAFTGGSGHVSFGCHIGGFAVGVLVAAYLKAIDSEALEAA